MTVAQTVEYSSWAGTECSSSMAEQFWRAVLFVCSMLCFLQHVQQPSLASIGNAAVDCQDDKLVDNDVTSNCVLQTITMTAIELGQLYRHELLLCALPSPCLKCVSVQCNDDTSLTHS